MRPRRTTGEAERLRRRRAAHHDKRKLKPTFREQNRERARRWKQANPERVSEMNARDYARRRADLLFQGRLQTLLNRVVRAHRAQGRFE